MIKGIYQIDLLQILTKLLINKKKKHAFEVQFQRLTQVLLTLCKPMDFPKQIFYNKVGIVHYNF